MGHHRCYCPFCGERLNIPFVKREEEHFCPNCYSRAKFIECKHEDEYYTKKGIEKYGECEEMRRRYGMLGFGRLILIEEEVSKNPLFDEEKSKLRNYDKQINAKQMEVISQNLQSKNSPKCPVCNSTNIVKISGLKRATHGFTFGLFSKTARSQFECKSCGYKF